MAASRTPQRDEDDASRSFSSMETADVDAIGAHCQMPFCRQLDFLPFRCESCKGKFCLEHRTESAHSCPRAGEWARRRAQAQQSSSGATTTTTTTPKPHILTHEQQCANPSCKTLIHTSLVTGVHCDKCRRDYCLRHRFPDDHGCAKLAPLGVRPAAAAAGPTQKERGLAALEKLRAWGAAKKAQMPQPGRKAAAAAAARVQQTQQLKRTAKGDDKIPVDKRVYLHVEASSDTLTAKIPRGAFFYSADYSVGRVLDAAAKSLQVSNLNNRSSSEEDKLRVFHVEGGRLLGFGEKLGQAVQTGNTVVLLRGVGEAMAKTPANT